MREKSAMVPVIGKIKEYICRIYECVRNKMENIRGERGYCFRHSSEKKGICDCAITKSIVVYRFSTNNTGLIDYSYAATE